MCHRNFSDRECKRMPAVTYGLEVKMQGFFAAVVKKAEKQPRASNSYSPWWLQRRHILKLTLPVRPCLMTILRAKLNLQ